MTPPPPWWSTATTTVVVPISHMTSASPSASPSSPPWIYDVRPSRELPTLDLSISFKSRLLRPHARKVFDRVMGFHRLLLVAYLVTTILYILVMVTPRHVGQYLSVVGSITGIPGTLCVLGSLRNDTTKLLLCTYDIVFFGTTVFTTLVVLMAMLRDARALIVVQALLAYQINIFTDANIEAVRRIVLVNLFAMLCTMFVAFCATLQVIPEMSHFTILSFGSHRLDAHDVITNGFVTVIAIMLRNTYRKRALLMKRSRGPVVDCVSYRCSLMLCAVASSSIPPPTTMAVSRARALAVPASVPHIQTMRYVPCFPLIDASRVALPQLLTWLTNDKQRTNSRIVFHTLGLVAAAVTIATASYEFIHFKTTSGAAAAADARTATAPAYYALLAAVWLTSVYTLSCAALCQRDLLLAILSSFDFVFLSSQLTFVHVATADFFRWHPYCVVLVATWLWSHWVFVVDALTPVVRERIGLSCVFIKVIITALVVSTGILNHLLLFSEDSIHVYDRVVYSGQLLGQHVEFRLLPTFYSTYVTVIACALRLMWRIVLARPHELVMLDGPVAYDNYLRRRPPPKAPSKSRRVSMPRPSLVGINHNVRVSISTSVATPHTMTTAIDLAPSITASADQDTTATKQLEASLDPVDGAASTSANT